MSEYADHLPISLRNRVFENRDPEDIDAENEEEAVGVTRSLDEIENEVNVDEYFECIDTAMAHITDHQGTATLREYDREMIASTTDVTNPGAWLIFARDRCVIEKASTYVTDQETRSKQRRQEDMELYNVVFDTDISNDQGFRTRQSQRRNELVDELNTKQRAVRDKLYSKLSDDDGSQLLLMVAGTAGCGKSRIIEVIELDCLLKYGYHGKHGPIILSAQTNEAAGLIGGGTCDSLMTLPIKWEDMSECSKSKWVYNKKESIGHVKVIIIDEKSLVGYGLMGRILQFWRAFDGDDEKRPFGGRHVIMLGCWYQLDAVADIPLWKPPPVTGKQAAVAMNVKDVIDQFEYIELDVNFRFKDDEEWKEIIRKSKYCEKPTAKELALLNAKVIADPAAAVAKLKQMYDADSSTDKVKLVTATRNMDVNTLNMHCCKGRDVFNVWAQHRQRGVHANAPSENAMYTNRFNLLSYPAKNFKVARQNDPRLAPLLQLAVGTRVKLNTTLSTSLNLAKNSSGTVIKFMYDVGDPETPRGFVIPNASQHQVATVQSNILLPTVLVQFDKYTGESFLSDTPRVVPITPITVPFTWCNEQPHRGDGKIWERTQLPLYVAEAMTAHKSQGQTCDFHLIHASEMFVRGLWHVQSSRICSLTGVVLMCKITEKHFTQFAAAAKKIAEAYERLRENTVGLE